MTSVLLYMAMREHLRWSLPVSAAVAGCFLIVDVPLALAALIYGVMWLGPPDGNGHEGDH